MFGLFSEPGNLGRPKGGAKVETGRKTRTLDLLSDRGRRALDFNRGIESQAEEENLMGGTCSNRTNVYGCQYLLPYTKRLRSTELIPGDRKVRGTEQRGPSLQPLTGKVELLGTGGEGKTRRPEASSEYT